MHQAIVNIGETCPVHLTTVDWEWSIHPKKLVRVQEARRVGEATKDVGERDVGEITAIR